VKATYVITTDAQGRETKMEQGEVEVEDLKVDTESHFKTAEVEMAVGFARGYGEVKVTALVRLHCTQSTFSVKQAGKAAHLLAYELALDGFNMVCADVDSVTK